MPTIANAITAIQKLRRPSPWLVVGKGPSAGLSLLHPQCAIISLNGAYETLSGLQPVISHFVDWDAFEQSRQRVAMTTPVMMPWRPHQKFKAGIATLDDLIAAGDQERPWIGYNATTSNLPVRRDLGMRFTLRYFSATSVFHILLASGVREIWTAGIDGGKAYAPGFDEQTRLSNGRSSFSEQWPVLKKLTQQFRARWTRLEPT